MIKNYLWSTWCKIWWPTPISCSLSIHIYTHVAPRAQLRIKELDETTQRDTETIAISKSQVTSMVSSSNRVSAWVPKARGIFGLPKANGTTRLQLRDCLRSLLDLAPPAPSSPSPAFFAGDRKERSHPISFLLQSLAAPLSFLSPSSSSWSVLATNK